MKRDFEVISNQRLNKDLDLEHQKGNYAGQHFMLVTETGVITKYARLHHPYRLSEARLARVISGRAVYLINLVEHTFSKGDIMVFPPETIVQVESLSDDYALEALSIIDLPGVKQELVSITFPEEPLHLSLADEDFQRMGDYLQFVGKQMQREEHSDTAISYLIISMGADIQKLHHSVIAQQSVRKQSNGEQLMARFLALLHQYGSTIRNIPFYAEQLALTPNHLSAVVRQQSGMSVMDWLNRTTVTEAKLLLKYSDLMIYEISNRLHFPEPTAFNRYFKKQVGMTPLKYREG